jgi:Ni2+-binding GTPase involved in maturation of urease and hydrogenase
MPSELTHSANAGGAWSSMSPLDRALSRLASAPPPAPVPVLVLSGFLGAGKTTLLQRVLTGSTGLRLAVLVNDMAEINIDAQMVASTTAATATQERVVALTSGCICCTLRDDLLTEVSRMAGASVRGQLPLLTRLRSI